MAPSRREVLDVGPVQVFPEEHLARAGDRPVDVYVRKLRVKLEQALPAWRFIHTHFGFGYRMAAEAKKPQRDSASHQRALTHSLTRR